jgi:ATP phosphoribosyltransferase-like protein
MIEVNAPEGRLNDVVALLPCMREATVAPLYGDSGYSVKAAVLRENLHEIIPAIKAAGGTDVAVTSISQIIP